MPRSVPADAKLPPAAEALAASQGRRALAACLSTKATTQRIQLFDKKSRAHSIEVPTAALRLLADILAELAEGREVKIVPVDAELTTQQAADLLNVSRPHLVKLLEAGELPYRKTGKHRRVRLDQLVAYKAQRDEESASAMAELAAQAQELRMGYE